MEGLSEHPLTVPLSSGHGSNCLFTVITRRRSTQSCPSDFSESQNSSSLLPLYRDHSSLLENQIALVAAGVLPGEELMPKAANREVVVETVDLCDTWAVAKSEVEEAVKTAIDVGYRHIDSAYVYMNEEEIGRAIWKKIADGTVKREDIFYTTKVWGTFFRPELVRTSLDTSLRKLGLSYVNLYLIHFPVALKPGEELIPKDKDGEIIFDTVDLCATWEAMEECKDLGLTKSIGVSNCNRRQLERILNKPGLKYKPVCNQVECHPYLNQSKLLAFCKSKDIVLTGYASLGSDSRKEWVNKDCPVVLKDPVLSAIAAKHGRTPAQVALRFQLQRDVVALVKSFREERIRENFQVFDFQLTAEDMESMEGLDKNMRYFTDAFVKHPDYPFFDEY